MTKVVDADGHVLEPFGIWERVDRKFRDRVPRLVKSDHGRDCLAIDGRTISTSTLSFGALIGAAGRPQTLQTFETLTYADARAGGSDPDARITDMDLEGIDTAILYPSVALFFGALDGDLAAALSHVYNEWLADYCRAQPARLIGIAAVPLQDVDAAVGELRRVVTKLGYRGVFVRPNPYGGVPLDDPRYDPFWAEAQELGAVVGIHEGLNSGMPTAGVDRYRVQWLKHAVSHPFEQQLALLSLIGGGVLERFSGLRVVFLESGCGWLPAWLHRLDEHYEKLAWQSPWLKHPPSHYFARQCHISCDADENMIGVVAGAVGPEKILYASDYPHFDAPFPDSVRLIRENSALASDVKDAVLGGNAGRLYGL